MSQERSSSHVVHVRENSASEMEALFKVVADPNAQEANKSIPFRDRNLPASFFQQPGLNQMGLPKGGPEGQGFGEVGPVSHLRAHSSPASLQQTLSAAPPPLGAHQHLRQHSCELLDEPLPQGWGMARTPQGQRYFLNHVLQTTTWVDPRKSHSPNSLGSPQQPGSPASGTQTPPGGPVDVTKMAVPHGWEKAYTPEGEMYFINHVERTTSWFHPSIPTQAQRPGMRLHQQQPNCPAPSFPSLPSPQQQQQQMRSPVSGASSPPVVAGGVPRGLNSADQQRQMKLKQLQMEKEMLMKRQEELNRQEMMIRKGGASGEAADQATEMTTVADPFLGQTGSSTDHSRQESADSGLGESHGGMGTNYAIRTPEDFLSNMEEMDIHDGGPKVPGQGDFGSMDIASVGDASDSHNMDSEDLVPSLQEDISSELLKDVENVLNSNKVDNLLTWL
ncbi:transcriptional coactivator YAP1-like [Littorina saxatilis]|uniref:WW domain-containing protein n=1 Tax=Littorina saxatilis TaxID=31220 RepID=A0AAN9AN33_9CAEN